MNCPVRCLEPRFILAAMIGLLCLVGTGNAPGQTAGDADDPARYRVEVVLFTQPPVDDRRREQAHSEPVALPPGPMAWPLRPDDGGVLGYPRLPAAEHALARAAQRIDARAGFRVLWHAAWEQPGLGPDRAQPVALPARLRAEGLSGFIRVYRQRFLHVEAELRYAQAEDRHWSMSASRRLRSDQQHYLDHPVLGVLVRVDEINPDGG